MEHYRTRTSLLEDSAQCTCKSVKRNLNPRAYLGAGRGHGPQMAEWLQIIMDGNIANTHRRKHCVRSNSVLTLDLDPSLV